MNRWIVAYDDADRSALTDKLLPLRHWARRTASPLLHRAVTWVPASSIKALSSFEQCDLVLFRAQEPLSGGIITGAIPARVQVALDRLTLDDGYLAVEYTAAMPANSNALGRVGRILDHASAGIPTVYAVPRAGYEGRDEGRGQDTSSVRGLHDRHHQGRIARNEILDIRAVAKGDFHYRELSRWVPLYALCLADTYSVPCAVVPLPEAVKTCPSIWRHSGAELEPVYRVISSVLNLRSRPHRTVPPFPLLRSTTERLVASGSRARPEPPAAWDFYVHANGHPNGSRRYPDGRDHLPFSVTRTVAFAVGGNPSRALKTLVRTVSIEAGRTTKTLTTGSRIPIEWNTRGLLIGMTPPPERHWREKTYVCRLLAAEHCFLRSSVQHRNRPWAMAQDARSRNHIVAMPLPVGSIQLWREAQTDVYVRRWIDFADALLLDDGVFAGRLWSTSTTTPSRLM
jgi:hypothetical protein